MPMYDTQMRVIAGLVLRVLSALRIDERWRFSFGSSTTVPACFDATREGSARWLTRGLVRPASAQKYVETVRTWACACPPTVYIFRNMRLSNPEAVGNKF